MNAPTGVSTSRELRQLRIRITGLITLLATAIVIVFAVVAIRLDDQLRTEQVDAELLLSTNRAAGLVGFSDGTVDFESIEPSALGDDVVVGVRPEFDVLEIVDGADFGDEIPDMSDEEAEERMDEVLDGFEPDEMAELLELEEPLDEEVMRQRVRDTRGDELFDEAYRGFLFDLAEDDGLELTMPTELFRSAGNPLSEAAARQAVELVADDDVDGVFSIENGELLARGVPLREGAEVRGAIIAVTDPADGRADHAAFRRTITALGIVLVVASAVAAWLVAGRTVRPAGRALAQQERFLADAAHELRTPIAAIRATAEASTPEGSGVALERVSELAGDAAQLTDDLLTLARMDADRLTLEREPVRLDLLVESLLDDDPSFTFSCEEDVIVDVDPNLVERAIGNLLGNARHHGRASVDNRADVIVERSGRVIVDDRGPGLDGSVAESVFERFSSSASSRGHGLGLPLTRWIARAHNGDCIVESSEGSGARFVIWFGSARGSI